MPDAIGTLSDCEYDCVAAARQDRVRNSVPLDFRKGHRHGIVSVGAEPGLALVESAANAAHVVVQDHILTIDATGKLGRGDFYLGGFVAGHSRVRDRDSPKQGGFEATR